MARPRPVRLLPAAAAGLASVALLAGCTDDEPTPEPVPEVDVDVTVEEVDAFLARVEERGYTCRQALADTEAYVACTRPRAEDARADVVRVTLSSDLTTVSRVVSCGGDPTLVGALAEELFGELPEVPDLTVRVLRFASGVEVQPCSSLVGEGAVVGGPGVTTLRDLDLEQVQRRLGGLGLDCSGSEDGQLDCISDEGTPGARFFASGAAQSVQLVVNGGTAAARRDAMARAVRTLAQRGSADLVTGARSCGATPQPCAHVVTDGYDFLFSADGRRQRLEIDPVYGF